LNRLPSLFIAVQMPLEAWGKVSHSLPVPSLLNLITSIDGRESVQAAWRIKHTITTPKQRRWVAAIKIGLKDTLFVEFDFIDEIFINTSSECHQAIYTLKELDRAFKAKKIDYPKYLQPSSKKELYDSMLFFAAKLHYKQILTLEVVIAAGLEMAAKLDDGPSNREIIKKAKEAIRYIEAHPEKYRERLSEEERKIVLSKAGRRGGIKSGDRKRKQGERTRQRVRELLESGQYRKPNGKPNVTALAKEIGVRRETVSRIIKGLVAVWFLFWLHLWDQTLLSDHRANRPLLMTATPFTCSRSFALSSIRQIKDTTLRPKALSHTFSNAHFTVV
jgi:hypothetical protein